MLRNDNGKQRRSYLRFGAVGIELGLSVVAGLLAGQWLDRKFDTGPWLSLVGLLFGVAAGFRSLIKTAKRAGEAVKQNDDQHE